VSFASNPFAKGTLPTGHKGMAPGGRTDDDDDDGSEGGREEGGEDEGEAGKPKCALAEG